MHKYIFSNTHTVPVVLKVIVFTGPWPLIRHVTDEVGKRSDVVMNSWDTITVIPFSIVTLSRVAYVVGMVTLVTFILDPILYICISSPSVPMCSLLRHSNMEEFLVTHVNTILCPGRAKCPRISVLFSETSLCAMAAWHIHTIEAEHDKWKKSHYNYVSHPSFPIQTLLCKS